jgi:hypothetical protein
VPGYGNRPEDPILPVPVSTKLPEPTSVDSPNPNVDGVPLSKAAGKWKAPPSPRPSPAKVRRTISGNQGGIKFKEPVQDPPIVQVSSIEDSALPGGFTMKQSSR